MSYNYYGYDHERSSPIMKLKAIIKEYVYVYIYTNIIHSISLDFIYNVEHDTDCSSAPYRYERK